MLEFDKFRLALANKITVEGAHSWHLEKCKLVLSDVGYEGHEVCNLGSYTIFEAFEEYAYGDNEDEWFDEWYEYEGEGVLRDWMLNMVPGVCSETMVKKIDRSLTN